MFCTHRISILLIKKTFHIIEYLPTEMNGRKRLTLFILLYIPKLLHTRKVLLMNIHSILYRSSITGYQLRPLSTNQYPLITTPYCNTL